MTKDFNSEFNALAEKPSVVAHRKVDFCSKALAFYTQPYLRQMLHREGLDQSDFIHFGMTIEGLPVHGNGQYFFIANGYAPEGISVPLRQDENYCLTIMSCCFMVESIGRSQNSLSLRPLCDLNRYGNLISSDEIALDSEKIDALFESIISERKADFVGEIGLATFKLDSYRREMLCWNRLFKNRDNGKLTFLLCDVDNGCLHFVKENDIAFMGPVSTSAERITTGFSSYLNNRNQRLIRNEHPRAKGGVGVFYG